MQKTQMRYIVSVWRVRQRPIIINNTLRPSSFSWWSQRGKIAWQYDECERENITEKRIEKSQHPHDIKRQRQVGTERVL